MADEDEPESPNPETPVEDEGTPEGASPEKAEFQPPRDGSWIPKARFDEARRGDLHRIDTLAAELQHEREQRIRLEERQKVKTEATPQYTRSQLQTLVDEGKLQQDQADAVWEQQLKERLKTEIQSEVEQQAKVSRKAATVKETLGQYCSLKPDVLVEGSEDRQAVTREYRFLVDNLGYPEGQETEAAACRAAFGPPEKLQALTRERRETPSESGAVKQEAPQMRLKVSNRLREFYAKQIAGGQYKGWDDPNLVAEMKIAAGR